MHKILLPNNEICTESDALVKIFSDHHKSVTFTPVTHRDTFTDFENFFNIKIDNIFHHKYVISDRITTAEIDHALKSMSAIFALGPSGQGKPLFKFFFVKISKFFHKFD